MLAARAHTDGARLRLETLPTPSPAAGECLVEIDSCGICASDLHIIDGALAAALPVTLGHEASGVVRQVGDGVQGRASGDRVVIDPLVVCGACPACRSGRPHVCRERKIVGIDRDGAFARYAAVPASNLVPLPDTVALDAAAMVESASTAYHALKRAPDFSGDHVAIVGAGGIGFHAIAIARLLGAATVSAVDVSASARERALAHGADVAYDATDPAIARQIRRDTGGGVAVVAECVGIPAAQETALACLRAGGTAVLVGVGPRPIAAPVTEVVVARELEVRGSFGYSRNEIEQVIRLAGTGRLDLSSAIGERYALSAFEAAVARFRSGEDKPVRVLVTVSPAE